MLLTPYPWFIPIRDNYYSLEEEFRRLEPVFTKPNTGQNEAVASIRSRWCSIVNDVRTIIEHWDKEIKIPEINTEDIRLLKAA